MVIARCLGPEQFFLERVVFPFELLSFQCPEHSELEIWTHGLGGAELVETIPVSDLLIDSELEPLGELGPLNGIEQPTSLHASPAAAMESAA